MTTEREENGAAQSSVDEPNDVEGLRALLDEERVKAQALYASWQRSAADFQNYKRRVEEERSETARLASAALIINMLPLLDDLDRALTNVDTHLAGLTWVDGIRLIHRKFQMLIEMDADGVDFDPTQHEAVSQAPGDENKVIAVVQKGYRLGDRVIRPAMVVVGTGEA